MEQNVIDLSKLRARITCSNCRVMTFVAGSEEMRYFIFDKNPKFTCPRCQAVSHFRRSFLVLEDHTNLPSGPPAPLRADLNRALVAEVTCQHCGHTGLLEDPKLTYRFIHRSHMVPFAVRCSGCGISSLSYDLILRSNLKTNPFQN